MAPMERRHTAEHVERFRRHGWVLIEALVSQGEIDAAQPDLFALYPTPQAFHAAAPDPRSDPFRENAAAPANKGDDPRFRPLQFAGLREFPFAGHALNLLALHPAIITAAEDLIGVPDVRLYQAEAFAKYAGVT